MELRYGDARRLLVSVLVACSVASVMSKPWSDLPDLWEALNQNAASDRPPYIECVASSECFKGFCCAIGRQRFALPKCMEASGLGSICFPEAEVVERNITYPDGATVNLSGVFDMVCPCEQDLYCDPASRTCQPYPRPEWQVEDNRLDDINNHYDD